MISRSTAGGSSSSMRSWSIAPILALAAPAGAADTSDPSLVPGSLLYRLAAAGVLTALVFITLKVTRFWRLPPLRRTDSIGPPHPLAWFAGAFAVYLVAQVLGGLAAMGVTDSPATPGSTPDFPNLARSSAAFYSVAVVISVGSIALFRRFGKRPPEPSVPWSGLLIGLVGFVVAVPVLAAVGDLSALLHTWIVGTRPDPIAHGTLQVLLEHRSDPLVLLLFAGAVVGAPVFEETVYRGLLQTSLVRAIRVRWLAIGLTAGLFTLAHTGAGGGVPYQALPQICTVGVVCGILREHPKAGLSGAMVFHALFNAGNILLALYLVPVGSPP
ncbi:MAG: CPBP family intramembrane metalloprotease [Cyanobacteria bacterium CYA]|nr:MAG: CPBP family intramembrane metalloprotease [Cyanobacteria bacterium CYA]